MPTLIYPIAPSFPVGVLKAQLSQELEATVWPADLFPISSSISGQKPDADGVISAGALHIEVPRALAGTENADAIAHFATHVPIKAAQGGVLTAGLGQGGYQGDQRFVSDAARLGGGTGVVAYWNGLDRTWRLMRDDTVIAVIP